MSVDIKDISFNFIVSCEDLKFTFHKFTQEIHCEECFLVWERIQAYKLVSIVSYHMLEQLTLF